MSYEDRVLTCRDCGRQFIFTAGEQEFYSQKGFLNDPVRCPECRRARKKPRERDMQKRNTHNPHPPQEYPQGSRTTS